MLIKLPYSSKRTVEFPLLSLPFNYLEQWTLSRPSSREKDIIPHFDGELNVLKISPGSLNWKTISHIDLRTTAITFICQDQHSAGWHLAHLNIGFVSTNSFSDFSTSRTLLRQCSSSYVTTFDIHSPKITRRIARTLHIRWKRNWITDFNYFDSIYSRNPNRMHT